MPYAFLPPNQQRQSTEGKNHSYLQQIIYCNKENICDTSFWTADVKGDPSEVSQWIKKG